MDILITIGKRENVDVIARRLQQSGYNLPNIITDKVNHIISCGVDLETYQKLREHGYVVAEYPDGCS